jgi:drug/metabolite transporter (DMT)-like permease
MQPVSSAAQDKRAGIALAAALAIIVVWGVNFTVQKYVYSATGPGGFLFARYLIMPVCAVALLFRTYGTKWPRVSRSDWWTLARLGVAGHFLHVSMVTFGIHWSTAFSSSLILACGPIFTLLILRLMGVEHLKRAQVIGVAIAFAGVLVFLSEKLPMIERLGGVVTMTYAVLIGSIPVVLFSMPAGLAVNWAEVPLTVWIAMIWGVTVSAFMGWLVWGWVNSVRGVARTAPLMYLMPPVAGLVAWAFAGEHYTTIKLIGAAVTMGGVAIAQFTGAPATLATAKSGLCSRAFPPPTNAATQHHKSPTS